MTLTGAVIIAGYISIAGVVSLAARALHGPTWAGLYVIAGLLLTALARISIAPEVIFLALALIWVGVGAAVSIRGEGAIALLLVASGLCYGGAQVAGAAVPGWSLWFRAADTLGIVALLGVLAGGDNGLRALAHSARRSLGAGDRRGSTVYLDRASALEEQAGER